MNIVTNNEISNLSYRRDDRSKSNFGESHINSGFTNITDEEKLSGSAQTNISNA